ncbi:hypothetical protein [Steroidobacter denitrificans]|uniref:hypothetical protein n=1 Tax=Steroidobacter denitrificans TaxID=465721 RepID=UPI0012EEBC94|nr:hypothetical protein [Steroidobacter denitrificans]
MISVRIGVARGQLRVAGARIPWSKDSTPIIEILHNLLKAIGLERGSTLAQNTGSTETGASLRAQRMPTIKKLGMKLSGYVV